MDIGESGNGPNVSSGSNRDFDFFYKGFEQNRLLIQHCDQCDSPCHPPAPFCPKCRSSAKRARAMSGTGIVHSFVIHRHPPLPGFAMPHPVALVELTEGVRVVGGMDGTPIEQIAIGMPVVAEFPRRDGVATLRFRPSTSVAGEA